MKSYVFVFAALCVALTSAQTTTTTPSPAPAAGPAPGTLGASDVAGIPIGPTPTSSGSDSSTSSTTSTPASVKPGAVGTATVAPSSGSFDEDALKSGSSDADSVLGDQSSDSESGDKSTSTSTSSSSGTKSVVTTPTPSPSSSAANAKSFAVGGSVATIAVVAISYLFNHQIVGSPVLQQHQLAQRKPKRCSGNTTHVCVANERLYKRPHVHGNRPNSTREAVRLVESVRWKGIIPQFAFEAPHITTQPTSKDVLHTLQALYQRTMKLSSVLVLAVFAVATTSSVYAQTDAAAGSKATDFVSGVGAPMLDGSDDDGSDSLDATVAPVRTTTATMGSSSDSMDSMDHSSSSKTSGTVGKSNSTSSTPAPTTSAAGVAHQTVLASVVTLAVTAAAALAC